MSVVPLGAGRHPTCSVHLRLWVQQGIQIRCEVSAVRKKAVVQRLEFPAGRRVLAISDIHGNLEFLKGVLAKAAFTPDDILILVGDLVEKGPDSLSTLRYIMELSQSHTVYAVCGNCDDLIVDFADLDTGYDRPFFRHYLSVWRERSLLLQMAAEAELQVTGPEDLAALRDTIRTRFVPELDFLRAMPTVLISDHFLFVHGGVPREERLEELDAWSCMKNDNFRAQGRSFYRWVVVGHWPVTLYDSHIPSARPIIDWESHIISIDGGCVLKLDGQLNALIIPDGNHREFSYVAYDGLPSAVALDRQMASSDSINVRWGEHAVTVLKRGEEISACRHLASGRELNILTSYLYEKDGKTVCEDSTDYRIPVEAGDKLHVVRRTSAGALVKKDGVTGWYFGRLKEL